MIETNKFARRPFYVDAVQVTEDNLNDVATWCQGDVRTTDMPEGAAVENYVKVRVHRPLTERQTKAFIGDWVLYAGTGFKVYTTKAFEKSFEEVDEEFDHTNYRDAETGEFVTEEYAEANPDTTVGETDNIFVEDNDV